MNDSIDRLPVQQALERHAQLRRALLRQFAQEARRAARRRRFIPIAGAGVAALAAGALAAVEYLESRDVPAPHTVRCYSMVQLGDGDEFPGTTVALAESDG